MCSEMVPQSPYPKVPTQISCSFHLKSGQILEVSFRNQWIPEPTRKKMMGSQEPMKPLYKRIH